MTDRSARSAHSTPPLTDEAGRLGVLARTLVLDDRPTSFGIEGLAAPEEVAVHVRELRAHPCDELLGFDAPPSWDAFGLVVPGTAQPWDGDTRHADDITPAREAEPEPRIQPGDGVVLALVVSRTGTTVSAMRRGGGDHDEPLLTTEPAGGMLTDVCRRVLGLPTPPPDVPVTRFWSALWLDRILDATTSLGPIAWETASLLHPAVEVLRDLGPERRDDTLPDETLDEDALKALDALDAELRPADEGSVSGRLLDALHRVLGQHYSWDDLHRELAEPGPAVLGLHADDIRWMDAGMLSRWLLGTLPDLDSLLDAVEQTCEPALTVRVRGSLRRWGMLPSVAG